MTDSMHERRDDRSLLVVFPDRATAAAARAALLDHGVTPAEVRIDEALDDVASLRAEMHEELTEAWVVPNAAAVYPSGAARGLALTSLVGVVLGVLAAFPLALLDLGGSYWTRWIVFAIVGAGFGLAVSLVVGPATGAPRPDAPPAAARGVSLRVDRDDTDLRRLLAGFDPVRLDQITREGDPVDTLLPERDRTATETAKDIAANATGDDYHEQR
jgi:hypothetical protein